MQSDSEASQAQLLAELDMLRKRLSELEHSEAQRRAAEEELRSKEEFNFALFNYNPAHTVVVDREGKVIRSNRARRQAGDRFPNIGDVMYIDFASSHNVDMHKHLMECIRTQVARNFPELEYGEKILRVTISPFPQGAIIVSEDITPSKTAERDRIKLITELRKALDQVETLQGLLPICAHCKQIRDPTGVWHTVEEYICTHSQADFSHTICPVCSRTFYPEMWRKKEQMSAA